MTNFKQIVFSFIFFFSVALSINVSASEVYYVSTNGSDDAIGSKEDPWQTIQHAIDEVKPGDTINVREGIYEELVNIEDIGDISKGWITIQAYEDEQVIIDGTPIEVTGSKRAGFSLKDAEGIHIEKFEIRNIKTDDEDRYPAGVLIRGASRYINVMNNNIHHIANYSEDGNAHGIVVYGNDKQTIEHITIQKNRVHNLTLGRSGALTVTGNVSEFVIDQNSVYDNNNIGIDIAGYYGACSDEGCIDFARNGVISNNLVIRNSSATNIAYNGKNSAAGIYVDGGKDIEITNNMVSKNDFGLSISSENYGNSASNVTLQSNLILHNDKAGLVIGGSSSDNGGAYNNFITENIFIENDRLNNGYREISIQHHNINNTFKHNIYYISNSKTYLYISSGANPKNRFQNETVYFLKHSQKH